MEFSHFSGVFGLYDGTAPIETGSAGVADRNFSLPNNPALSYQTASGTKGFTAAAIFTLAAEGKLSLDDRVKAILEKNQGWKKYGSLAWLADHVTVRALLNHTSGVPDYYDEDYIDDFERALRGNANYHFVRPEHFFPLTENVWKEEKKPYASRGVFKYCNGGFVILAAVVEAVSGESFRNYVTKHVFEAFGMQKSGFFRFDEETPSGVIRASSYQANGRSNIYAVPVIGGGDGGAYTNPQDMAFFWNALDPKLHPGAPLSSLIEEAWTPRYEGEDGFYGLGFWISSKNPAIVFLEGIDPGVQFFSFYNRKTGKSLTICLNDEAQNCDEIFEKYYAMVE